ncbi:MAG: hypothetical protein KA059_06495 [Elusimicrobiales bacterium]|nr:hypothetical protein [Elusimicrobiales bacterium]
MKKIILAGFLGIISLNAFCDDIKPSETNKKWYVEAVKKVKLKLNSLLNPTKTASVTSVFGIRGNDYDSKNSLYWKNMNTDKLNDKISADKKALESIIKQIEDGKIDEAKTGLKNFIKNNPNSYIINDAKELLNNLNTESSNSDSNTDDAGDEK